jgi:DNA-binding transcriptional MerR regulator
MDFAATRHATNLTVADAMRIFGLTARALRFYEERGLLRASRDRQNHRCYDFTARQRLAWIASLRAAGVGLADILEVLEAEDRQSDGRQTALIKLDARRRALQAELVQVDDAISSLRRRAPANDLPAHARLVRTQMGERRP